MCIYIYVCVCVCIDHTTLYNRLSDGFLRTSTACASRQASTIFSLTTEEPQQAQGTAWRRHRMRVYLYMYIYNCISTEEKRYGK